MIDVFVEMFGLNSVQVFVLLFVLIVLAIGTLYILIVHDLSERAWAKAAEMMGLTHQGSSLKEQVLEGTYNGFDLRVASRYESERRTGLNADKGYDTAYFIEIHLPLSSHWADFGRVHKNSPATLRRDKAPRLLRAISPTAFEDELHTHIKPDSVIRGVMAESDVREAILKSSINAGNLVLSGGKLMVEHKTRVHSAQTLQAYVDEAVALAQLLEERAAAFQKSAEAMPARQPAPADARVSYW